MRNRSQMNMQEWKSEPLTGQNTPVSQVSSEVLFLLLSRRKKAIIFYKVCPLHPHAHYRLCQPELWPAVLKGDWFGDVQRNWRNILLTRCRWNIKKMRTITKERSMPRVMLRMMISKKCRSRHRCINSKVRANKIDNRQPGETQGQRKEPHDDGEKLSPETVAN